MTVVYGLFWCLNCDRVWPDDLPPLWMEEWPECCGVSARLKELLVSGADVLAMLHDGVTLF